MADHAKCRYGGLVKYLVPPVKEPLRLVSVYIACVIGGTKHEEVILGAFSQFYRER